MTAQATQAKLHMRSRATTPFARRLDEYLKTTSETSLDKPLKDSKLLSNKKVPKWLSELDDLGFVDSDTYRQFIDTAVAKGSLDEARTWAEKARAQGMPLTAQDLQSLISQALTTNDADAAKLWLEQTLSTEELTTHQKQKICFLAVFLVARKMGFGVLHDLLLKGGEEPSRWLRNKARWLLEILRATRSDGLEELGRRLDDALQVGVEADHSVFRYLLYEALKVPDFEYVTKWFTKAVRHGVVPETPIVNHIIGEVAKMQGLAAAEEWFEKATRAGVKPNVYTYKYLMQAASKEDRGPERWFRSSLAAGIHPDVVTFNTLINAAAKKGNLDEAVSWFHMALSMSVRPDMLTYNMVLAAAAQAGDGNAAQKWFNKMQEDGFLPDIVSYNSFMKALMKSARTRDVEELFWKMKAASVSPDVVTIKTMRWALGRQRVKELLHDADLLSEQWSDEQMAANLGAGVVA
ncbi:unnamed protein product [Durusdinium trenchii]|uniref:Mitochondrial n=1 Tax=Durusdinium trenchii TaxID=1381693 RepID=A0ABP0KX24_9DINO